MQHNRVENDCFIFQALHDTRVDCTNSYSSDFIKYDPLKQNLIFDKRTRLIAAGLLRKLEI